MSPSVGLRAGATYREDMPDGPTGFTADEFFALVDAHLTDPMAELGYHRIHGSVHDTPGARGALTTDGGRVENSEPYLWFNFGFEAGSDDVCRLLGPNDPLSEDEWWLHYEPETGRLELGAWVPAAQPYVDWDLWRDKGPCNRDEVQRRLMAVGMAVRAFVGSAERRGDFQLG